MDGPMIAGASRGIGVPELSLKQLTTRGVEATCVCNGSRILAAQLWVGACGGRAAKHSVAGE